MFIQIENEEHHYPAYKRKIIDVSGAGDAVIATAALALAQKLDYQILAKLANLAGGLSCEKVGVNPIKGKFIKRGYSFNIIHKIYNALHLFHALL